MDPAPDPSQDPIVTLLENYNELNSDRITVLYEEPSALEFMRYVAINRPFVVRGAAKDWEATRTWNVAKLNEIMGGLKVNIAITPKGNADSPTKDSSGNLLFIKPLEEEENFNSFLSYLTTQELHGLVPGSEIKYAQTQNNNLNNEYTPLSPHVPPSIPFSRLALKNQPDAVNLWIGNSHSVTALHKDPYENIYVQILGRKRFLLLPPVAYPCVKERMLRCATYVRDGEGRLGIELDGDGEGEGDVRVPFATWDPDVKEGGEEGGYERFARPVRVELEEGDMLYLPALWYHKVSQSCNEEGLCCAVNYWHDMEFSGSFYPLVNLVRNLTLAKEKEKEKENNTKAEAEDI